MADKFPKSESIIHKENVVFKEHKLDHESDIVITPMEGSLDFFYIQRYSDKRKIENFADEVSVIAEIQPEAQDIKTGEIYLVQYSIDDSWYRAIVLSLVKDSEYKVKFVDYGNEDKVTASRIKICPPSLHVKEIPPLTYECKLWNIKPWPGNQWSKEAIAIFNDLDRISKQVGVFVYDSEENESTDFVQNLPTYYVDFQFIPRNIGVSDDLLISLREALIFLEHGRSVGLQCKEEVKCGSLGGRFYYSPVVLLDSSYVPVTLLSCSSPAEFTVKLKSSSKAMEDLVSEMHELYDNLDSDTCALWSIFVPKVEMLCAVKDSKNNTWLRAKVEALLPQSQIRVLYIDKGKQDTVHVSLLRKLPDSLLNLSSQAIQCSLSYVSPLERNGGEWTTSACKYFKSLLYNSQKNIQMCFNASVDNIYEASIQVECDQVVEDVAGLLIGQDHAVPHDTIVNIGYSRLNKSDRQENASFYSDNLQSNNKLRSRRSCQVIDSFSKSSQEVLSGDATIVDKVKSQYHSVKIIQVTSPFLIHARFTSLDKKFADFQQYLHKKVAKQNCSMDSAPSLGKLCLINFHNKSPYFARGKIIEETSSGFKVHLVDCGGITDVVRENVLSLLPQFHSHTSLALIVSLVGIHPPCGMTTWPSTSINFLRSEIEENPNIYMIKNNPSYKDKNFWNLKVLPVEMGYLHTIDVGPFEPPSSVYFSFKSILLEEGLALPVRSVAHKELEGSYKDFELDNAASCQNSFENNSRSSMQENDCNDHDEDDADDQVVHDSSYSSNAFVEQNDSTTSKSSSTLKKVEEENSTDGASASAEVHKEPPPFPFPPQPPIPENFQGLVTYVDDGAVICIQPTSSEEFLHQMYLVHDIKFRTSDLSDNDLCWDVGGFVVAKFHLDSHWYRGKIIKRVDAAEVKVEFIDFGNVEVVPLEDIRNENLFPEVPIQCYKCRLAHITPRDSISGWTVRNLEILHTLVVMNKYDVKVVKFDLDGYPLVELRPTLEKELDLLDLLVDKVRICNYVTESSTADDEPDVVVLSEE